LKTTNGGANWIKQRESGAYYDRLPSIFFLDANTGWTVGGSGTIFKTANGGTNWTKSPGWPRWYLNSVQFIDAKVGFAVGTGGVIIKTTRGG
jgi:photosystem II stability/assembly factor-like uncharacterized protein